MHVIEEISVAEKVSQLMINVTDDLNDSIAMVQSNCSRDEFVKYRLAVASVMGEIFMEVLQPLYLKHHSLKPPAFDASNTDGGFVT